MFTHPSFGTIRTAGSADNPLFCLRDLCKTLGLDSSQVRKRLMDGVVTIHPIPDAKGRTQRTMFVSEPGMYKVIFQSRKKEAEAFTDWVTSEVLPSIRKSGYYGQIPAIANDFYSRVERLLVSLDKRISVLENNQLSLPADEPCAQEGWTLGKLAKELGVDSYYLVCLLSSIRVIRRTRHVITSANAKSQSLFLNLPFSVPFYGGTERWDEILISEEGKKEILDCYPTYKKQHPYNY